MMTDQVIRLYQIIKLLPRHPEMTLTIPLLQNKLLDQGYDVSLRTLQRDMKALESIFIGIDSCKRTDRSICWFWAEEMPVTISKLKIKQQWRNGFKVELSERLYCDAA